MNDGDRTLTIDLGYADPPVPPDLVERVRAGGRSLRRRRRITAAATPLVVAGLVVSGGLVADRLSGSPDRGAVQPAVKRPPAVQLPPASKDARAVVTWPDGAVQYVYWWEQDGLPFLCGGNLPNPADPDPFAYEKVAAGDSPAACGNVSMNGPGFRGGGGDQRDVAGHPTPAGMQRWLDYGHVLGPVTRVTVELRGVTYEASIARSTDPGVGTLWGVGALLDRPLHSTDVIRRTAYLGTKVVDIEVEDLSPNAKPTIEASPPG
jgi:hypothetical protein